MDEVFSGDDYNRIAAALSIAHKRQPGLARSVQVSVVAMNFCAALEKQDPGFDQVRFMRAVREGTPYAPEADHLESVRKASRTAVINHLTAYGHHEAAGLDKAELHRRTKDDLMHTHAELHSTCAPEALMPRENDPATPPCEWAPEDLEDIIRSRNGRSGVYLITVSEQWPG